MILVESTVEENGQWRKTVSRFWRKMEPPKISTIVTIPNCWIVNKERGSNKLQKYSTSL